MKKIVFSSKAVADLTRLKNFVVEKNPNAAITITNHLKKDIKKISKHPDIGLPVKGMISIRDFFILSYITRYKIEDDAIIILRIWHHKEDWK